MRKNTEDKTLERNYQQKWKFLISEYQMVKQKKHARFKFVSDFYKAYGISRQIFNKYHNRYLRHGNGTVLLPEKRGAKWQSRRPDAAIEARVLEERRKGLNRYEIFDILKPHLQDKSPLSSHK